MVRDQARRSLLLGALAAAALGAGATAQAAESIGYRLSLDTKWGPMVMEGDTPYVNDQFSIYLANWGGPVSVRGRLIGDAMKVSGDWMGNYMAGEGTIVDRRFIVPMRVTGELLSALISLSVPPSVAARLGQTGTP